jgi:DNA mismatch repair ATPase MutS
MDSQSAPSVAAPLTPMMAQYFALKAQGGRLPAVLPHGRFFRAVLRRRKGGGATLDIALTSRGEHDGAPIPMCGVPVHSAEGYLARLIVPGTGLRSPSRRKPRRRRRRAADPRRSSRAVSSAYVTAGTLTEERCSMRAATTCWSPWRGCGRDRHRGLRHLDRAVRGEVCAPALDARRWRGWARARSC